MMNAFLVIVGTGLCVFLPRYLPIVLFKDKELPPWLKDVFGYVPPSVLAAIVVPSLLMPGSGVELRLDFSNPYLIAGLLAVAMTVLTKRVILTSFVATLVFFLLRNIVGL